MGCCWQSPKFARVVISATPQPTRLPDELPRCLCSSFMSLVAYCRHVVHCSSLHRRPLLFVDCASSCSHHVVERSLHSELAQLSTRWSKVMAWLFSASSSCFRLAPGCELATSRLEFCAESCTSIASSLTTRPDKTVACVGLTLMISLRLTHRNGG